MADDKQHYESGMSEGQAEHGHEGNMAGQGQEKRRVALTREEIAVLKECNRESFWFRCLPLGLTFIATTQLLVMRGVLKPHPKYGALFKNMGAGLAGFFIGRISYQGKCREKILRLENSPLADTVRKSRSWADNFGVASRQDEDSQVADHAAHSVDSKKSRLTESDGAQREYRGLEENQRPSMDKETYVRLSDQTGKESQRFSYDQLRSQNRAEYNQKITKERQGGDTAERTSDAVLSSSDMSVRGISEPRTDQSQQGSTSSKNVKKNQYGDVIES